MGKELKSGDFVFLKVVSGEGKEYQISIKGVLIPVKSDLKLSIGEKMRARIVQEGGKYSFKLIGDKTPLLKSFESINGGLRDMYALEAGFGKLARGLLRSGFPLNPEILRAIPVSIRKQAEKDDFLSRLVGILLKKGISPEEISVDSILSGILGNGLATGENSGKRKRDGFDKNDSDDEDSEMKISSEELKDMWGGGECKNPIHLFNHISSKDEHWMILPISMAGRKKVLEGFAAIKILKGRNEPASLFLRCFDDSGDHDFYIDWKNGEKGRIMRASSFLKEGNPKELKNWVKFLEKLQNLGVEFDDTNNRGIVFDGFTAEDDVTSLGGIERFG
ncbi:MAG: hypothetical protein JEY99_07505 [Spirochaetales bacterium]|nr:hypothetical protein [Spirochaetales bacterium]